MDSRELAPLVWKLSGVDLQGASALVALAVLGANLNQCAARAAHILAQVKRSQRAVEMALADLIERGVLLNRGGRYAFAQFEPLLPRNGLPIPPQSAADEPHPAADLPQQAAAQPQSAALAQKAVVFEFVKTNSNNNNVVKNETTTGDFPMLEQDLAEYARVACRMENSDVVVSHLLKTFSLDKSIAALEQYHQDYTSINAQAKNPSGQLIAWCVAPAKMRGLSNNALRLVPWIGRRRAMEAAPRLDTSSLPVRENVELSEAERVVSRAMNAAMQGKGRGPTPEQFNAAREAKALRESKGLTSTAAQG